MLWTQRRTVGRAVLTLLLAVFLATPSFAQSYGQFEEELKRPTLRGLPGVFLLLNMPRLVVGSPQRDRIVAEVELVLRSAGVKLYSTEELQKDPRVPKLLISFSTTDPVPSTDTIGWGLAVELSQGVMLDRDPRIYTSAVTWKVAGSFGFGPMDSILATVREEVVTSAKRFANAYLAANAN